MSKREYILQTVEDLVSNFLFYDRKDDEELGKGDIEEAVQRGDVTIAEIEERFSKHLREALEE